jgi:hypothetical protein
VCVLRVTRSDLIPFEEAQVHEGMYVVRCTRFKTQDFHSEDMIVLPPEVRSLVQWYVEHIRPTFAQRYNSGGVTKRLRDLAPEK